MALTPVRTKRKSCFEMMKQSKKNASSNVDVEVLQQYIDSFNGLEITEVYKNFDFTKTYRMEISEGTFKKEIDHGAYKQFWVSPEYEEVMFERGDYISFIYAQRMCTFIISSIDNQYPYLTKGHLYHCNNILNLVDEFGQLRQYPVIFNDKAQRVNFNFTKAVNTQAGSIEIDLRMDEYTNKIRVDDRYLFDGQAYKVTYVGSHNNNYYDLHEGIMTVMMSVTSLLNDDDIENNIANASRLNVYKIHTDRLVIEDTVGNMGHINAWVTKNGERVDEPLCYEIIDNVINKQDFNTCDIGCKYPYASCVPKAIEKNVLNVTDIFDYEGLNVGSCKVKIWMKNNVDKFVIIDFKIIDIPIVQQDIITIEVTPKINAIRQGQKVDFICKKYKNGKETGEMLDVIDNSTIKNGYYLLEGNNNNFTITCLKEHRSKKVELEISDGLGNKENLFISLIGVW